MSDLAGVRPEREDNDGTAIGGRAELSRRCWAPQQRHQSGSFFFLEMFRDGGRRRQYMFSLAGVGQGELHCTYQGYGRPGGGNGKYTYVGS
ncbi:hypothetical protein BS78_01G281200 [Paspalum vaginatum]|nr:hypothetical protein BS78_01G281200 [Paspalum vaginatum]